MRHIAIAALAALSLSACNMSSSEPTLATEGVTDAMLAAGNGEEWLTYGGDYDERRFSPLTQINADNVGELGLAWSADLDTARGQEATPLMHDGTLYITTAWSKVKAYDAKTGALKWEYDPEVPRSKLVEVCCDAVNRGIALYGDKAYVATLDGRLVALDQKTGAVVWDKLTIPQGASTPYPETRPRASRTRRWSGPPRPGAASGGNWAAAAPYGIRSRMTRPPTSSISAPPMPSRGTRPIATLTVPGTAFTPPRSWP